MTADQMIEHAADAAQRMYPTEPEQRALYECEMLRRYVRELAARVEPDAMAAPRLLASTFELSAPSDSEVRLSEGFGHTWRSKHGTEYTRRHDARSGDADMQRVRHVFVLGPGRGRGRRGARFLGGVGLPGLQRRRTHELETVGRPARWNCGLTTRVQRPAPPGLRTPTRRPAWVRWNE